MSEYTFFISFFLKLGGERPHDRPLVLRQSKTEGCKSGCKSDIFWCMDTLRIESIADPFTDPGPGSLASRIIAFASTAGLLKGKEIRSLDLNTWKEVLSRLRAAGLLRAAPFLAVPSGRSLSTEELADELRQLYEAIEESPLPESEWASMRELLDDQMLAKLLGVSRQSIHRYSSGERATPQEVAERLHVLALIVSDLAGSYNEFGIRRWFERPRSQLAGRSPSVVLKRGWSPDDDDVRRVRGLAAALVGAGAT